MIDVGVNVSEKMDEAHIFWGECHPMVGFSRWMEPHCGHHNLQPCHGLLHEIQYQE